MKIAEQAPAGVGTEGVQHNSEERCWQMVEAAREGIALVDPEDRITYANREMARQIGVTRAELVGRRLEEFLDPEVQALVASLPTGPGTEHAYRILALRQPNGTRWVSASAASIDTGRGESAGRIVTFTDITPLHELQEQRDELVRAVSHDVRNPLAVVQAQAQLLLRTLDRAGRTGLERTSAEAILSSAKRMNTMIQDLVDAARLEAGQLRIEPRPLDLQAFVLELKQRLADVSEAERIEIQAPAGLPPVLADPERLERILSNLVDNALKHSPPTTGVSIDLHRENGEVMIAVSDRGPGFPPEELPRVFERHAQGQPAHERGEGAGLGLYVARLLVEAQRGHIWVESRAGAGSTFYVSLPTPGEERA